MLSLQVASYVPLTIIITERRGVIRKRMNALDNAREGRATDMLLNYETVKYFCNERFELGGYDRATRQYQVRRILADGAPGRAVYSCNPMPPPPSWPSLAGCGVLANGVPGHAVHHLVNRGPASFPHRPCKPPSPAPRRPQAAEYWQMAFLAMLSITQASVVWLGLAAGMVVCVRGVVDGSLTVGDAVLFVTMMNQLYIPLTFFGSYYRQVK